MDEDEIRRRKLAEKQRDQEQKKAEEQLKTLLRTALDDAGYDRMSNVKLSNSELFMQAAQNVLGVYQRLGRRLTDKEVLFILTSIKKRTEHKSSITFARK